MGLENFTSDDDDVNGSDESTNASGIKKPTKENQPSMTNQSFGPEEKIAPRDIKFQVKTFNYNWQKQFSHYRSKDGELVMYSTSTENTVAVFTGIRAFDSEHPYSEMLDIGVCQWDLEKNEPLYDMLTIEYTDEWKQKLVNYIQDIADY